MAFKHRVDTTATVLPDHVVHCLVPAGDLSLLLPVETMVHGYAAPDIQILSRGHHVFVLAEGFERCTVTWYMEGAAPAVGFFVRRWALGQRAPIESGERRVLLENGSGQEIVRHVHEWLG
jgi:hypothetical protein